MDTGEFPGSEQVGKCNKLPKFLAGIPQSVDDRPPGVGENPWSPGRFPEIPAASDTEKESLEVTGIFSVYATRTDTDHKERPFCYTPCYCHDFEQH